MTLSKQHIQYKGIISKENYFETIVGSIQSALSIDQLRRLKIVDNGETYDLWDQIFLRCVDNRYCLPSRQSEVLAKVDSFLEKYVFLLDSNLDNTRIRNIFMKSLMDFISVGSGVFFAKEDYYGLEFGCRNTRCCNFEVMVFRLHERFRKDFLKVCQLIANKYPSIPKLDVCGVKVKDSHEGEGKSCTLDEMMSISYSYAFWKLLKNQQITLEGFEEEFRRRIKGYLESLSQCSPIFVNKYKEEIFRELSSSLGMDVDRSYFVYLSFLKDLKGDQYKDKDDLSEFISDLFTEEELKLLELQDVKGNTGSFQEQIKDRYYSKYPSFVAAQEMEDHLRKKVEEYRPLLSETTVEVIRDAMLDEIERECFVSHTTYLWNREMEKNLEKGKCRCFYKVVKAIDLLISMMPTGAVKQLSMDVNGREVSLREQLICRGKRSGFAYYLKDFKEYLSQMHLLTPYNLEYWNQKETISRIDLQALLEEIDMFFLYPQRWRMVKKIMSRLDNGRVVGQANVDRIKIAQRGESYNRFQKRAGIIGIFMFLTLLFTFYMCMYY